MATQALSHTDIHNSESYRKQSKNNTCYRRNKPRSRVKTSSCNKPHSRHSPLHPAPLEHPGSFLFLCSPFIRKELQLRREGGGRCGHYGGGVVWELQVPEPDRGWSKPHTVQWGRGDWRYVGGKSSFPSTFPLAPGRSRGKPGSLLQSPVGLHPQTGASRHSWKS